MLRYEPGSHQAAISNHKCLILFEQGLWSGERQKSFGDFVEERKSQNINTKEMTWVEKQQRVDTRVPGAAAAAIF